MIGREWSVITMLHLEACLFFGLPFIIGWQLWTGCTLEAHNAMSHAACAQMHQHLCNTSFISVTMLLQHELMRLEDGMCSALLENSIMKGCMLWEWLGRLKAKCMWCSSHNLFKLSGSNVRPRLSLLCCKRDIVWSSCYICTEMDRKSLVLH